MKAVACFHYSSLVEIAGELRSRRLSPVELTRALLARVERLNPELGAYYRVLADEALARAREAEAEIGRGEWRRPLHGIPIAFQDLFNLGPTIAGSPLLAANVAGKEAKLVRRARVAGAVIMGKLATPEFALAARPLAAQF